MRKLAAYLAVALATVGIGLPSASATSAVSSASSTTSVADQAASSSEPSLTITSVGTPVLQPETDLEVSATITNPTDESITITRLELRSGQRAPATNAQVYSWMSGAAPSSWLASEDVEIELAGGQSTTRRLRIAAADVPWQTGTYTWGPRGFEMIATLGDSTTLGDRSMLIVGAAEPTNTVPTTVVVPVTQSGDGLADVPTLNEVLESGGIANDAGGAPTDEPGDGATSAEETSEEPAEESGTGESVEADDLPTDDASGDATGTPTTDESSTEDSPAEQSADGADATERPTSTILDSADVENVATTVTDWSAPGVSLVIDPSFLAAEGMAEAIEQTAAEVQLLPMYDSDLAALAHLANEEAAADALTATRDAAQEAGLDVGATYYLPEETVDLDTLEFVAGQGLTGAVIGEEMMTPTTTSSYQPAAATSAEESGLPLDAVVTNEALSSALAGTLISPSPEAKPMALDDLDARQITLALSAVQFRERPNDPRGVVAQLPRFDQPTGALTAAKALLAAPWVNGVGLDDQVPNGNSSIRAADVPQTVINPGEIGVSDYPALVLGLERCENFTSIIANPDPVLEDAHARATWVTGVVWRDQPEARSEQIAGLDPIDYLDPGVRVEESSTINMISETSSLPLHVTNPLPFDVHVLVGLDTPDTRLQASDPVEVTIPASSTVPVSMPVEAWGSGNLNVVAQVTNAAGVPVGVDQEIEVRVRADWENVGTALVAGGVLVLFIVGVVKSVREGRRSEPVSPATFSANLEGGNVDK